MGGQDMQFRGYQGTGTMGGQDMQVRGYQGTGTKGGPHMKFRGYQGTGTMGGQDMQYRYCTYIGDIHCKAGDRHDDCNHHTLYKLSQDFELQSRLFSSVVDPNSFHSDLVWIGCNILFSGIRMLTGLYKKYRSGFGPKDLDPTTNYQNTIKPF